MVATEEATAVVPVGAAVKVREAAEAEAAVTAEV